MPGEKRLVEGFLVSLYWRDWGLRWLILQLRSRKIKGETKRFCNQEDQEKGATPQGKVHLKQGGDTHEIARRSKKKRKKRRKSEKPVERRRKELQRAAGSGGNARRWNEPRAKRALSREKR